MSHHHLKINVAKPQAILKSQKMKVEWDIESCLDKTPLGICVPPLLCGPSMVLGQRPPLEDR